MADDPTINPSPYVDNDNARLLQQLEALSKGQQLTSLPLKQQRALFRQGQSASPPHPNVQITHFKVETVHGNVTTFVCRPKGKKGSLPFVFHIHGGGWVLADAFDCIAFLSDIVERTKMAVVFPEYTLAPERMFPDQQQQCVEVMQYLMKHGHEKESLVDRIVISCDSAGGEEFLAHNLSLQLSFDTLADD